MHRLILSLLASFALAAPLFAQEAEPETGQEQAAENEAGEDESKEDSDLDVQGYEDEDQDDFDPTDEVSADQSLEFPTDI